MRRFLRYWLPLLIWTAAVLTASGPGLSSQHTGSFLSTFLAFILGHPVSEASVHPMHVAIRKCAHLFEYGVLSALAFRAIRAEREGFDLSWAVAAMILTVAIAAGDEWHQTFVPGRTGTPWDVLLDGVGGLVAQGVVVLWNRRR